MAEAYDIFISYSNKDSHIVHQYARFLENNGYKVWYDAKGLYGGVKFAGEIANAIEASKLLYEQHLKYKDRVSRPDSFENPNPRDTKRSLPLDDMDDNKNKRKKCC